MCTAITLNNKKTFLFGRNLDLEVSFGQKIVISPRKYEIPLKFQKKIKQKYAIIGMATVVNDIENNNLACPLFAEAANEKGLAAAGLNFPETAFYPQPGEIKNSFELAPFEFISYILAMFSTTEEVKKFLSKNNVQLVNKAFAKGMPVAPLHFIVTDRNENSIVVEPCLDGLKVYDNKLGILTNNPTFDWQITNLSFYQNLTTKQKYNVEWYNNPIKPFGQGFASFGLPGDWTPPSRFVRAAFLKSFSPIEEDKNKLINQFFHILDNVAMVKGTIVVDNKLGENYDITIYSSCIDLNECIYYYKTYNNCQINAISMKNENLDSKKLIIYPFNDEINFNEINNKK